MPKQVVRSDMAAIVARKGFADGRSVTAGDTVLVLEAMKMEIPVDAPASGRLVDLKVEIGDAVDEYQILFAIEA